MMVADNRHGVPFNKLLKRPWALIAVIVVFCGASLGAVRADVTAPRSLFVMDCDGSNVRSVVHVDGYRSMGSPRWSHDGKRFAFDGRNADPSGNRFFLVNADGTELADGGPGTFADWSPDDKQLAFATGHNPKLKTGVWVQNINGQGQQWLSKGTAPRWSPDGSQVALYAGAFKCLDLTLGGEHNLFAKEDQVKRIRFGYDWSPDGARLAVIVERENMQPALVIADAAGSSAPRQVRWEANCNDVAWSPDGKTLAVSIFNSEQGEHRICLLPVDGDEAPAEIPGQQGDNREVAWSPDGTQLAFASSRRDVDWNMHSLEKADVRLELVRTHDKGGTVYSVGLTPDGRTALIGGDMSNRGVQIWDTTSGEVRHRINMPGVFVAVSPDGRHGAVAPFIGGHVEYVDLDTGVSVRDFNHGAPVVSLDFSGDGSRLVTSGADKCVCAFDVASGDQLSRTQHPEAVKRVAFSPDGKLIAVTCADENLYLWNADTGEKVREMKHPACPWGVAFSPDGGTVMTGTGGVLTGKPSDLMIQPEADNTLRVWDVESGKLLREMKGHTHTISSIAYSPNGRRAVTASFDRSLRLWDVETGKELSRAEGNGWCINAVFSYDGKLVIVSGGAEKNSQEAKWYEYPQERVRVFRVTAVDDDE